MERIRRRPSHSEERERAARGAPPRREPPHVEALLDLQHAAGNRGVAAAFGGVVQRQPKGGKNDGGVLTLGGDEIPIKTATWSMKVRTTRHDVGQARESTLEPTNREVSNIVLTRRPDAHSERWADLRDKEFEQATLRLDRPSGDGMLPATSLDLDSVGLVSFSKTKEDEPSERIELYVNDFSVAGLGKEDAARKPAESRGRFGTSGTWDLRVVPQGGDAWPAFPVISAESDWARQEESGAGSAAGLGSLKAKRAAMTPSHITVKILAGKALTRVSEAFRKNLRLDLELSVQGRYVIELGDAIVEKISSTNDGAGVVEVGFVGERTRTQVLR